MENHMAVSQSRPSAGGMYSALLYRVLSSNTLSIITNELCIIIVLVILMIYNFEVNSECSPRYTKITNINPKCMCRYYVVS